MKTTPVDIKPVKELGNPAFAIDTPRDHIRLGSLISEGSSTDISGRQAT